jgi:HK97 family phage portal protein
MFDALRTAIKKSLAGVVGLSGVNYWPYHSWRTLSLYDSIYRSYAQLYEQQPNVRTCVDFLARNVAQLGLHTFRRVSDTDRQRLTDHPLAQLIARPNAWTTRYRLIESLMADLGIYFNAYWLKFRQDGQLSAILRIPPDMVTVTGGMVPTAYEITLGGTVLKPQPADVVHFRGYNPLNSTVGLSPLETLRRILAEEHAMGDYRENFWKNSARMAGVIERPSSAPDWGPDARERFKLEWESLYAGTSNSGKTAVLEEDMKWKQISFTAQESEYLSGRKLTREECARAYHIPLPMVGILDHATFSNISEQHQNLYQDCLSPWLRMIEEEIALQLLPDLDDSADVYVEFNLSEKLAGDFAEQTKALQSSVGRPWMTANEARARLNLPRIEGSGADELVTPLNVLVGGQASPRDTGKSIAELTTKGDPETKAAPGKLDATQPELRERYEGRWRGMLTRQFERQRNAVIPKIGKSQRPEDVWDADRWNNELTADIFGLNFATAVAWARYVAEMLSSEFDEDGFGDFLSENARISAENINRTTLMQISSVWDADDRLAAVKNVFAIAMASRAAEIAAAKTTTASVYGSTQAARQGGLRSKTWQVNSQNPRDEHAAMDGETVGIGELFSNGMAWPGDPAGGPENNSNCRCSCVFGR